MDFLDLTYLHFSVTVDRGGQVLENSNGFLGTFLGRPFSFGVHRCLIFFGPRDFPWEISSEDDTSNESRTRDYTACGKNMN